MKDNVLMAEEDWCGIVLDFEGFMAKWIGLEAAHQSKGVTRTNLATENKAWMLGNLTGQTVQKTAIEAATDCAWRAAA